MKELNLIGQKYNMITIIKFSHKAENHMNYWICLCDCGKETIVSTHNIRAGEVKSCGCLNKINGEKKQDDLLGRKFNKLTVIKKYYDEKKSKVFWLCKCDCGNNKIIKTAGSDLKSGKVKSCGCFKAKKLLFGENAFNRLYDVYKRRALKKEISFTISKERFKEITSQNCFYCNIPPKQKATPTNNRGFGYYMYNGIDRIDSKKGYEESNIVPCCGQCNIAKNDYSYEEFISWVQRINNNLSINNKVYKELENLKI